MKHIPNKIYLQIGEDCDAEDFKDLNEVTWCQVEIHSNDIEYVRSSQQPEDEVEVWCGCGDKLSKRSDGFYWCLGCDHGVEILAKRKESSK